MRRITQQTLEKSPGEHLPVAVLELNPLGMVLSVNAAAELLFGLPAGELVGSPVPSHDEWDRTDSMRSTKGQRPVSSTVGIVRPDGTSRTCDLIAATTPGAIGAPPRTLIVAWDITDRDNDFEEVRTHNRLLLDAHDVAELGSWAWDLASETIRWSPTHCEIFGVDPTTFVPSLTRLWEMLHEEDLAMVQQTLDHAIETTTPWKFSFRIRRPDGAVRWVESVGTPKVVDGVAVGYVGTLGDVTERELSLESLRDSEARYKMIVETAREAIWVVDVDANTTFANQRLAELLGVPVDELMGESVFSFLDAEGKEVAAGSFAILREGRPNRFDFRFVLPTGSELWALISAAPILDAGGQYTGALAMLTDITERHHTEVSLRRSEAQLAEAQSLAHLGNWAVDRATGTMTGSTELYRMFEVDPMRGHITFEHLLRSADGGDRARVEAFNRQVHTGSDPLVDEFRIATPSGTVLWVSVRATPVFDGDGTAAEMRGTVQDVTERRESEERLVHISRHDQLTQLPNRALFNDRLDEALSREHDLVAVMLVDLDGFKAINDGVGHVAGDALLLTVADRLADALEPSDTLARFGGDEFTILLNGTTTEEASRTAERLLQAVAVPIEVEGRKILAQASIGLVVGRAGLRVADDLLREADAAMYAAKRKGGNRCESFSPSMHAAVAERLALECDLRSVELGIEMTLHYQPIIDLKDGHVAGVEALLRWEHPRRGSLSPAEFIPIAEDIGAIVSIGRWILEEACSQRSIWRRRHPEIAGLSVNVNVSARQLADPAIVGDVKRALQQTDTPPGLLTLEITETMILADEDEAFERLKELKELGVRISVDDFGTGYSSLGHLDRFPIDELKIDRSFVASLGGDSPDSGVALATIRLAQSLRLDVVAEGIEHQDQLIELRRASCTKGQGYYFWKPMDVASVDALLAGGCAVVLPAAAPRVVLVVDDDPAILHSTCRLLRTAGLEPLEATGGREALEVADTVRLDAVVLDIELPDIDGFEVSRQLAEKFHDGLPVLHVSGVAVDVDDRVHGLGMGAHAYLTKPVAPAELLAVLGSMFRRTRSGHGV